MIRFAIFIACALSTGNLYARACIGNYVWHDQNGDGLQTPGEPALAGVRLTLVNARGKVIDKDISGSRGFWKLCRSSNGYGTLQVDIPPGFEPTLQAQGSRYEDSNIDSLGVASVRMPANTDRSHWDVGLFRTKPAEQSSPETIDLTPQVSQVDQSPELEVDQVPEREEDPIPAPQAVAVPTLQAAPLLAPLAAPTVVAELTASPFAAPPPQKTVPRPRENPVAVAAPVNIVKPPATKPAATNSGGAPQSPTTGPLVDEQNTTNVKWASRQQIYGGASSTVSWGDLDGDGDKDLFVAGGDIYHDGSPVLAWFEAPSFTKRNMGQALTGFVGGSAIADIDGDGDLDVAFPNDPLDRAVGNDSGAVYWLENGANWRRHTVDSNVANGRHYGDFRAEDMDGDGRVDLLSRHLDPFGFVVWFQNANDQWALSRIPTRRREGLHVADLDGDGLPDIVGNGFILFADNPRNGSYTELIIDNTFFNQDSSSTHLNDSVKAGTADIDGDGKLDLVMAQAEGTDGVLAWYRSPQNPRTDKWQRNVIEPSIRTHQVLIADIDSDGDPDIAGAETWSSDGVFWWENVSGVFKRKIIDANGSCYNCEISDFDLDGDMDIAGPASFNGPVRLYEGIGSN